MKRIMRRFESTPLLILDCQTTGMRPSVGSLLEISWSLVSTAGVAGEDPVIHSRLVELPREEKIPWQVSEITGLTDQAMVDAVPRESVLAEIKQVLMSLPARPVALIHYAPFEKPWLEDLFGAELPFDIVCSYQIAKKLFPQLPSRNIRAVSGFFGAHAGEIKRAAQHVRATIGIWWGLRAEFDQRGWQDWDEVLGFLSAKNGPRPEKKYEYRIARDLRLALPERPGVYRMVAKSGEILYVGKATSLRDRVNSYFRGQKGRDRRKLEMLAQVWDLNFTECGSALEAALLESDEIKRLNPPYNVSLKRGRRKLIFYSRDFEKVGSEQSEEFPLGAFRAFNSIEDLRTLLYSLRSGVFSQIFHAVLPEEDLAEGLRLFRERHGIQHSRLKEMRDLLKIAVQIYRRTEKWKTQSEDLTESEELEEEAESPPNESLTPEEVSEKYDRLFCRAGRELWRVKHLTRLLNSSVSWETPEGPRTLHVTGGKIGEPREEIFPNSLAFPWRGLDIGDYDRMSVLYSGLKPPATRKIAQAADDKFHAPKSP